MAVSREVQYDVTEVVKPLGFTDEALFGEDTLVPSNSLLLGKTSRTSTTIGRSATVAAGEDIRPALESLKSAGGGTLILLEGVHNVDYDIVGGSNINIVGEGRDITIIDFQGGAQGIKFIGTSSEILENFKIKDLSVQNSNATAGIDIDYADYWRIVNIAVSSGSQTGVRVLRSKYYSVIGVLSDSNTGDGFLVTTLNSSDRVQQDFTYSDCHALDNGGDGFSIICYGFSAANTLKRGNFFRCTAESNTGDGFVTAPLDGSFDENPGLSFLGCKSFSNTGWGFVQGYDGDLYVMCETSPSNTSGGFQVTGDSNSFVGCEGAGRYQGGSFPAWEITGSGNILSGCRFSTQSVANGVENDVYNDIVDTLTQAMTNDGASSTTSIEIQQMTNTSGGALVAGNVVVLKAAASGEEVTTTTTQGDDFVYGMLLEAAADNADKKVLLRGKTKLLKVNGTSAIAVGDFLCTYTVAGISAKASAGDMAFAIALEAYSTADSNGVIDALLISPRKL